MIKKKFLWGTCLIISSIASTQVVNAKPGYPFAAPQSFQKDGIRSTTTYIMSGGVIPTSSAINCYTCHSGTPFTENNVTTSFGVAFNRYGDDGALATAYATLAPIDSDGDGFSNTQEAFAGSDLNIKASTPLLTGSVTSGNISAKPYVGTMTANDLSLTPLAGTNILGGMVSFTAPNNPNITQATATFMFKDGGVQTGATITFYDKTGTVIPANATDSIFLPNVNNGSVDVGVKDEGVFDLYSTTAFQQEAIARSTASTISPYTTVDPYISPWAKISPWATIEPYATVDAYAVVDDYAVVGPYAQIGAYAYIAPHIDVYSAGTINSYAQISPYAQIDSYVTSPGIVAAKNGTGYVSAKFSVTTTKPTAWLFGTAAGNGEGSSTGGGGLHCMTTGLGTQGFMFLGLLAGVFLLRRKLN